MTERLQALSDAGVSIWLDDLSRDRINTGNLADLVADSNVVGVTTNPTIFAGALSKGNAYDDQIRELAGRRLELVEDTIKALTTDDVRNACDILAAGLRGHRRRRRPGLDRGRARAGERHRRHHRPGRRPLEDRRPAERVDQDPGDQARPAGDHRVDRGGDQRQRHADLLPRPLPRRDRRLPVRAGAGRRQRPRPVQDPLGGVVLRLPGRHRGGQAARRRSAPTRPRR